MIRIRDISLPPRHNVSQLSFEAAQLLRVSNSTIRKVRIVRRSIDARKKPDVKYNYTIDVQVNGNEEKILRNSRCKKASIAPWTSYKVKPLKTVPDKRPVVIGFGPAGMFAALVLAMVISSISGTVIPLFFKKIKVDPAVASGPLITTINDLVAIVTYYGLAWILLLNVLHF